MSAYLLYVALVAILIGFGIGLYLWLEVGRLQGALADAEAERDELLRLHNPESSSISSMDTGESYDGS